MATWKAWQRHQDRTEVCEKNGKFYLKAYPDKFYNSFEEASKVSERIRNFFCF